MLLHKTTLLAPQPRTQQGVAPLTEVKIKCELASILRLRGVLNPAVPAHAAILDACAPPDNAPLPPVAARPQQPPPAAAAEPAIGHGQDKPVEQPAAPANAAAIAVKRELGVKLEGASRFLYGLWAGCLKDHGAC
jgi:hypothetical protein